MSSRLMIGAQYYRPPFPEEKHWEDDLSRMADAGLNTVQLWVLWAWVESEPGRFQFDDYDRLVELAGRKGLGLVLSTVAEIHPYWIHREVPGSEMVTNFGQKVVSSNREECHFGLTPGGCFDHPGVWDRMAVFLREVVVRYRACPSLRGWDAWNELRWNVNADGAVCYCPHTIQRFRGWLDAKYGGLEGLNKAWVRRYSSWEDVRPGKMPRGPYTEMMAFQEFISWRSCMHGRARYDVMKACDPGHPVTLHGGIPTINSTGEYPINMAQDRGNDWSYADHVDGVGCSSFPAWGAGQDAADFSVRIDGPASAARGKQLWLSELQGGRASSGFRLSRPVTAAEQQRWLWTGLSKGASTILFWCWRDEVFGRESSGFGIIGRDGHAEARLAALKRSGDIVRRHGGLLEAYRRDAPETGVFYSPQTYFLHWAEEGRGIVAQESLKGYARALTRLNIPLTFIEENHLDELRGLRILFMPRVLVIDDHTAEALSEFVRGGGTLVCESECGAFTSQGLYRSPEERFLARLTGIQEMGRRSLEGDSLSIRLDGRSVDIPASQWLTPLVEGKGEVLARYSEGPLVVKADVGKGKVILCGTYSGQSYYQGSFHGAKPYAGTCPGFEQFVEFLVRQAGVQTMVRIMEAGVAGAPFVQVATGVSGSRRLAFVFSADADPVRLRFRRGFFRGPVTDLIQGGPVAVSETPEFQECRVADTAWGVAVLAG